MAQKDSRQKSRELRKEQEKRNDEPDFAKQDDDQENTDIAQRSGNAGEHRDMHGLTVDHPDVLALGQILRDKIRDKIEEQQKYKDNLRNFLVHGYIVECCCKFVRLGIFFIHHARNSFSLFIMLITR